MATITETRQGAVIVKKVSDVETRSQAISRYFVLPGRLFFSLIFILSSFSHFSRQGIAYAAQQGVPMAGLLVPLSGALALLGGLSIFLGYRARIGGWLIVAFLVPVTFMMHNFWTFADPTMAQLQLVNFMKNLSMLGGAFLITYFGSGPYSLDRTLESQTSRDRSLRRT